MSRQPQKKVMPKKIEILLKNAALSGPNNFKYRWAINIFEKYRRHYIFNEHFIYQLGLFYDHLAMMHLGTLIPKEKKKITTKKKVLAEKYLKQAISVYQEILQKNPKYFLALYGIGRVFEIRKQYKKALHYRLKAYRLMKESASKNKPLLLLGIGGTYEAMKDYKNAEKWFKQDLKDLGANDLGANANLFSFYERRNGYRKAYPYAIKTEKLLKTTPANFQNSRTADLLRKRIANVKARIKK